MDSLFDNESGTAQPPKIYTVSQLTTEIRNQLEERIGRVWVEAEVSTARTPASGHLYLTLKDASSQIRAVAFKNKLRYLGYRPQEGDQLLIFGRLTVYEPRGEYQLIIDHFEPLGAGALALAFEELKKKLAAEGLFDPAHKKPLPTLPRRIGVVTSPTGAALWDFLRTLNRRHPGLSVLIHPSLVQGEAAPGQLVEALAALNRMADPVEVIVLTRGGGSLEDLWAFNTEPVARAVFASKIPVISAVGHEVDFTIADFVADLRASTPTGAAEGLIRPRAEWLAEIDRLAERLTGGLEKSMDRHRSRLEGLTGRLSDPSRRLDQARLRLSEWLERLVLVQHRDLDSKRRDLTGLTGRLIDPGRDLDRKKARLAEVTDLLNRAARRCLADQSGDLEGLAERLIKATPGQSLELLKNRCRSADEALRWRMNSRLKNAGLRTGGLIERLDSLSPLAVLGRGYSLTRGPAGEVVRETAQVSLGDRVSVSLARGELGCRVEEIREEEPPD